MGESTRELNVKTSPSRLLPSPSMIKFFINRKLISLVVATTTSLFKENSGVCFGNILVVSYVPLVPLNTVSNTISLVPVRSDRFELPGFIATSVGESSSVSAASAVE